MKELYFEEKGIYYRTNDFKPEKKTIVFIHGVSGSCSAWWPFEKIFKNKYNILTYDIRGHGKSKKYPKYEDYSVKNFANDLYDLVTFLKIEKFILISSSFATLIAREYLKDHRKTVTALVFTSTEAFNENELRIKIIRPVLKAMTNVISLFPFNPKIRGHVDYSKLKNWDWSPERNFADTRNTGLRSQFFTIRQSFVPGQNYELEKINVPTLIIHGEKDSIIPIKNAIDFSKKIKNSKFIKIQKFDHDIHHNAVKEMSEAIEDFVNEIK
ncbi:MAG: alpha/beta hydrolase [bacterium]